MSTPIPGSPVFDEQGERLARQIEETISSVFCKNLDLRTAKKLAKAMKHAIAELDSCIVTKLSQSIGGRTSNKARLHQGANPGGELFS